MPEKMKVTDVVVFFKQDDDAALQEGRCPAQENSRRQEKDPWSLVLDGTFIVRNLDVHKDKHREVYEAAKTQTRQAFRRDQAWTASTSSSSWSFAPEAVDLR